MSQASATPFGAWSLENEKRHLRVAFFVSAGKNIPQDQAIAPFRQI